MSTPAPSRLNIDHRVFESSPNPYLLLSLDLVITAVNAAYLALFNAKREDFLNRPIFDVFPSHHQESSNRLRASFMQVIARQSPHTISLLNYAVTEGDELQDRYWTVKNTPLFNAEGALEAILNCPIEVTRMVASLASARERGSEPLRDASSMETLQINHHLYTEQLRFRQLMQQAPGFLTVLRGPCHVFEIANNAYYQLVGHRDILGVPVRQALPELEGQGFYELLDRVYETGQPFMGRAMPIQVQAAPGAPLVERYIDFIYQPIMDDNGDVSGIFVQGNDVSEAHELSKTVGYQASHDSLTGLINRREFEVRLARAVEEADEGRGPQSLLYLDLDQFKVVNDTCGHAAGDELLRQVGACLSATVTPHDTVARLGGDEFGILLVGADTHAARQVAEQLRDAIDRMDFSWNRRTFGSSASVGVITFSKDNGGVADILCAADSACLLAKERGRNRVEIHHPDDDEIVARRREVDWVSRLKEAMAQDRLCIYAQRIRPANKSLRDPCMRMEILLRLRESDGTMIPPMAFIPAAERFGLMPAIDRLVIKRVFRQLALLPSAAREKLYLSINLSGHTLSDDRLLPFVREQLQEDPTLAARICFEITETAALLQLSRTAQVMLEMKSMGFRFALDDFGSGMSSMSYLKQLPVDYLKIDGSFVRQITTDPTDAVMVEAMAKVAAVMGIGTVAEYVEKEATWAMLATMNIDYVQGFYVHVPEPFEEAIGEHTLSWQDL